MMENPNLKYWAIIPAAGTGERMKQSMPKQYCLLNDKTILEYSLISFIEHKLIEKIIVVVSPQDMVWKTLEVSQHPKIETALGGKHRAQSVFNGLLHLQTLGARTNDWVLVHDAARPCLTHELLNHLIENLKDDKVGGLLAVPVRDTLKRVLNERVEKTVSRENLWQAQTPQMFRHGLLFEVLEKTLMNKSDIPIANEFSGVGTNRPKYFGFSQSRKAKDEGYITDEAIALESFGKSPKIILGDIKNIKITFPEDLEWVRLLLLKQK